MRCTRIVFVVFVTRYMWFGTFIARFQRKFFQLDGILHCWQWKAYLNAVDDFTIVNYYYLLLCIYVYRVVFLRLNFTQKNTLNIRKNRAIILLLIDDLETENRINFQSDKCDSSVIEDHAIREKFILTVHSWIEYKFESIMIDTNNCTFLTSPKSI